MGFLLKVLLHGGSCLNSCFDCDPCLTVAHDREESGRRAQKEGHTHQGAENTHTYCAAALLQSVAPLNRV